MKFKITTGILCKYTRIRSRFEIVSNPIYLLYFLINISDTFFSETSLLDRLTLKEMILKLYYSNKSNNLLEFCSLTRGEKSISYK